MEPYLHTSEKDPASPVLVSPIWAQNSGCRITQDYVCSYPLGISLLCRWPTSKDSQDSKIIIHWPPRSLLLKEGNDTSFHISVIHDPPLQRKIAVYVL